MDSNDYAAKRNERRKKQKAKKEIEVPHPRKFHVALAPGERSKRKYARIAKEEKRQADCFVVRAMDTRGKIHDVSRRVRRLNRGRRHVG